MEIFIVLGLCFVLYEALDIFQGCYQHYHQTDEDAGSGRGRGQGSTRSSSLANIKKHNKSVLSRANQIIKDIIVEGEEEEDGEEEDADHERLIDEEQAPGHSSAPRLLLPSVVVIDKAEGQVYQVEHEEEEEEEEEEVEEVQDEESSILSGSGSDNLEAKKRLLWRMELLNENSASLIRPQRHAQPKRPTTIDRNNDFATNCGEPSATLDEYDKAHVNMIRVFSVSECVQ